MVPPIAFQHGCPAHSVLSWRNEDKTHVGSRRNCFKSRSVLWETKLYKHYPPRAPKGWGDEHCSATDKQCFQSFWLIIPLILLHTSYLAQEFCQPVPSYSIRTNTNYVSCSRFRGKWNVIDKSLMISSASENFFSDRKITERPNSETHEGALTIWIRTQEAFSWVQKEPVCPILNLFELVCIF